VRAALSNRTIVEMRQARRLLMTAIGIVILLGLVRAQSIEGFAAYAMITAAAILPAALWLRASAPGIPILPAIAAFHYLYFALPILRQELGGSYTPGEVLRAGATVALFLFSATVAWGLVVGKATRRHGSDTAREIRVGDGGRLVMFAGLAIGVIFQVAVMGGWLAAVGTYYGVVRGMSLTAASVACYLLGYFRARGLLRGQAWVWALAGAGAMVILAWSTLYLVGGMQFVLAAGLGYVIAAKRIPWSSLVPLMAVLFVLHAGKAEMRERYWAEGPETLSPIELPGRLAEWVGLGITNLASGEDKADIIDRASLLYLLLYVEQVTPDYIPYLGGETYALLPEYMVPRFLNPDKTFSQAGLALLSTRYGLESTDAVGTTTLAWGVVTEAFANFGYLGVIGAALMLGLLTAFFTRWSAGQPPLSLPMLLSVVALISLTNLEADFGFLLVNLWQALIAGLLIFIPLKLLSGMGSPVAPAWSAPVGS
jgi:hypothetical protein